MFVLVFSDLNDDSRRSETRKYKSYNAIINGENDQPIDSDIQRYEEIWKLTTGQNEDYTTRRLLDYGYIKNHYRLIPVDLSRQRELDADPKAIKQIKLVDCMFLSCHVRVWEWIHTL